MLAASGLNFKMPRQDAYAEGAACAGQSVSPTPAPGESILADGRDPHLGGWPVEVLVPRGRQAGLHSGIETMQMIRKGQMVCPEGAALSDDEQFYSLAF